jgi:dynein heavy chain
MVDFTVTQKGLEEQLLGRVIQKEQRSLEENLKNVMEEVTNNTKALIRLDQMLLERLSENSGNLLEDEELITVLADIKAKATQVKEKLVAAADVRKNISDKREQYRPVATRGSVLYFSIVDMTTVNCMYQTSLDQFQKLFDKSMDIAEKANMPSRRVNSIIDAMTYLSSRYVTRGLYERDKICFKLILACKILSTAGKLDSNLMSLFLKGGGALDINQVKPKTFAWMSNSAWLNLMQLCDSSGGVFNLLDDFERNEHQWISWYNENEPEKCTVSHIENKFAHEESCVAHFFRLLLVRCLREDRTLIAVGDFLRRIETIEVNGSRLPVLGPRYVEAVTDTVDSVFREMDATTPVIFLLSAGADPTDSIETLSKRKRRAIESISMGEGQDVIASRAIQTATINGSWVLLQNCHLGLAFINTVEEVLLKLRHPDSGCHPDFRLFISTEPHPLFSIGLMQMSIKVTNEPPKGLRAGLQRSYTTIIDQDRIDRIETTAWRTLLYAVCFTHSVVQERRKFGPLGWCIPYEFNDGDLTATITFLEKHLESGAAISWPTVQYMVAEVQYGGKITDDMDRRVFGAYTEVWLSSATLAPGFRFNPNAGTQKSGSDQHLYIVPNLLETDEYLSFIQKLPEVDTPEVLGLHSNADLSFRFKEVNQLLDTIVETQPKQTGSVSGGKTREDIVLAKCLELLEQVPAEYVEDVYDESIVGMGGYGVPLNIFLFQEVQRMHAVIVKVRQILLLVMQAIRGEVVVSAEILDAINAIFDARVPRTWLYSAAGDEVSWLAPNLGLWFGSLVTRDEQYRLWLSKGRPSSFFISGFFNPQGFLTSVMQEIARNHKGETWALDLVSLHSEVTEMESPENVKSAPRVRF